MKAQRKEGGGSPSNPDNNSNLITSISDIEERDNQLTNVTRPLGESEYRLVRIGSIFKIDSSLYPMWGIGITDENRDALKRKSDEMYRKDYKERIKDEEIEYILKTDFKVTNGSRMAEFIGITAREMLRSLDDGKRQFLICDVPARDGQLSTAIAHALSRDSKTQGILERTVFHLVDVSEDKIKKATSVLSQFGVRIEKQLRHDEEFFDELNGRHRFDMVVSLSHFHHKSFLSDYLRKIHRVLADDGALVVGDWHSAICSHPAYIYELLQKTGLEPRRLDEFRSVMREYLLQNREPLEEEELKAMVDHMEHWGTIASRLRSTTSTIKRRVYVLGAYDTSKQREKKLEEAGFTTDIEKIRTAFPKARLAEFSKPDAAVKKFVSGSDSAVVMSAVKKPRKR